MVKPNSQGLKVKWGFRWDRNLATNALTSNFPWSELSLTNNRTQQGPVEKESELDSQQWEANSFCYRKDQLEYRML